MLTLINANAILRYLLNDDIKMAERAEIVIRTGAWTIPEVLAEVISFLHGVYQLLRKKIGSTLTNSLNEITITDQSVITSALTLYATKNIDFVDAILVSHSKLLGEQVFSFDKQLNKLL